ncbi:hypothetical protein, partial [Micromonospora costi]|uniref:hypothetical protein n=1 Tax=Micromonospora costi TaxID=1530042 RepID=UPI0019D43AF6
MWSGSKDAHWRAGRRHLPRTRYFRFEIVDADRSTEMTDVTITNRRADSSANENLATLARHGADT